MWLLTFASVWCIIITSSKYTNKSTEVVKMTKYIDNPVRQNNGKWIFNDDDMNMIGLWVSYAAQALRENGCPACADDAEQF